jgi:hypothetical protein
LERISCAITLDTISSSVKGLVGGGCENKESGHTLAPNKSHGFIFKLCADLRRLMCILVDEENANATPEIATIIISPKRRYHIWDLVVFCLARCLSLLNLLKLLKLLNPLRILPKKKDITYPNYT